MIINNIEIERKFLLSEIPDTKPTPFDGFIEAYYCDHTDDNFYIRLSKMWLDDGEISHFLSVKSVLPELKRIEINTAISEGAYEGWKQFQSRNTCYIKKRRIHHGSWSIDIFEDPREFILAEIELYKEDEKIKIPKIFGKAVEVTGDWQYYGNNIANINNATEANNS